MTPTWFIGTLLALNLAASVSFAFLRNWPWCLIYGGAAVIQAGCWWASR